MVYCCLGFLGLSFCRFSCVCFAFWWSGFVVVSGMVISPFVG